MLSGLTIFAFPAKAHRLDEYLQATVVSITRQHIDVILRLTPGKNEFPRILRQMDTNGDGSLSGQEQYKYAQSVADRLSFSLDHIRIPLKLEEYAFPPIADLQAGSGVIRLYFKVSLDIKLGLHQLRYANQGVGPDIVYSVNGLLPHDPAVHVLHQQRSFNQSVYELDFTVD